jgi:beta-glucanase (GH16 family)
MLKNLLTSLFVGTVVGQSLIFSDDFAGTQVNSSLWFADSGCYDTQCFTAQPNVLFLTNGSLAILPVLNRTCIDNTTCFDVQSARLDTWSVFSSSRGRYEISAKLPTGAQLRPFFSLMVDPEDAQAKRILNPIAKIDILAAAGNVSRVSPAILSNDGQVDGPTQLDTGFYSAVNTSFNETFHTFALDWSCTDLVLSVDGNIVLRKGVDEFPLVRNDKTMFAPDWLNFYLALDVEAV